MSIKFIAVIKQLLCSLLEISIFASIVDFFFVSILPIYTLYIYLIFAEKLNEKKFNNVSTYSQKTQTCTSTLLILTTPSWQRLLDVSESKKELDDAWAGDRRVFGVVYPNLPEHSDEQLKQMLLHPALRLATAPTFIKVLKVLTVF